MSILLTLFLLAGAGDGSTMTCAHRGDAHSAPEYTVAAFASAAKKGAHMIEFDVYASVDEERVVIHDDTVDRTTNGTGKVVEMSLSMKWYRE